MPSIPAFGASPRPTVSIHLYGAIFTHEPNMHTESPAATAALSGALSPAQPTAQMPHYPRKAVPL